MRGLRIDLLQHPNDLEQLVHQGGFVLQPAGGVDQDDVVALGLGLGIGVEGQAGGVGAVAAALEGRPGALGPDFQLFAGCGAEGVAGDDHHLRPLTGQVGGDLAQGRGLARAVDPDEQGDERSRAAQRFVAGLVVDEFRSHGLRQRLLDLTLIGARAEAQLAEAGHDPVCGRGPEIALQQMLFQPLERGLGQRFLDEGRDDLFGHLLRGAGEALGQAREPALFRRVVHALALAGARGQVTANHGAAPPLALNEH